MATGGEADTLAISVKQRRKTLNKYKHEWLTYAPHIVLASYACTCQDLENSRRNGTEPSPDIVEHEELLRKIIIERMK